MIVSLQASSRRYAAPRPPAFCDVGGFLIPQQQSNPDRDTIIKQRLDAWLAASRAAAELHRAAVLIITQPKKKEEEHAEDR